MVAQESEATLRNMQTGDRDQVLGGGGELGELDDEGDEEDEIVVSSLSRSKSKQKEKSSTGKKSSADSGQLWNFLVYPGRSS